MQTDGSPVHFLSASIAHLELQPSPSSVSSSSQLSLPTMRPSPHTERHANPARAQTQPSSTRSQSAAHPSSSSVLPSSHTSAPLTMPSPHTTVETQFLPLTSH